MPLESMMRHARPPSTPSTRSFSASLNMDGSVLGAWHRGQLLGTTASPPMRAKAGDPPRTMVQKILAGRSSGATVKADQAVLARTPHVALDEAISRGLKKTPLE